MKSRRFGWMLLIAAPLVFVGAFYQNCANSAFSPRAVSFDLPFDHPSVDGSGGGASAITHSKLLIGDQRFLESAFREAFLMEESPQNEKDFLEAVLVQELRAEQHLLGRGCDPMETGDAGVCAYILNNAQIGMSAQTSSGREAARLQVCRRVVSNDAMTGRLVKSLSGGDITPNPTAMDSIVRLFYPNVDQGVVDEAVERLAELDLAMAGGGERINDRWKVLLLTVCESSGWEAL